MMSVLMFSKEQNFYKNRRLSSQQSQHCKKLRNLTSVSNVAIREGTGTVRAFAPIRFMILLEKVIGVRK